MKSVWKLSLALGVGIAAFTGASLAQDWVVNRNTPEPSGQMAALPIPISERAAHLAAPNGESQIIPSQIGDYTEAGLRRSFDASEPGARIALRPRLEDAP